MTNPTWPIGPKENELVERVARAIDPVAFDTESRAGQKGYRYRAQRRRDAESNARAVIEALRPELEDAKRWVEEERAISLYSCELKDFGGCGPVVLCPPCEARASIKRREGDAALRPELEDAEPIKIEWDYSIHTNPSAQVWAATFAKMYPACNVPEDVILGWFANAMMAMHDFLKGGGPINGDHAQFLLDQDTARQEGKPT